MSIEKTCVICGSKFLARRKDAVACSNECREARKKETVNKANQKYRAKKTGEPAGEKEGPYISYGKKKAAEFMKTIPPIDVNVEGATVHETPASEKKAEPQEVMHAPEVKAPEKKAEPKRSNLGVVFISGKVTGDSGYIAKFNLAERKLKDSGYQVINPTCLRLPETCTWENYMELSLRMLDMADILCQLPDWKESRGACIEYGYFLGQDKDICPISWLLEK